MFRMNPLQPWPPPARTTDSNVCAGRAMPSSGISSGSVELLHLSWLLPGFALRDVIFCFPSLFISLLKPVGIRPCSEGLSVRGCRPDQEL